MEANFHGISLTFVVIDQKVKRMTENIIKHKTTKKIETTHDLHNDCKAKIAETIIYTIK